MSNPTYGIVCAMREEVEKIVQALDLKESVTDLIPLTLNYKMYTGPNIVLIESKIGKVASTMATLLLIERHDPEYIINIGLAGSLNPMYKAGEAYCITNVIQHDTYMPIEEYKKDMYQTLDCYLKIPNHPMSILTARLATGDQFVDTSKTAIDADLVDMEGFAVAYTAKAFNKKCVLIKGVSDNASDTAEEDMFANLNKAMDATIKVLKAII